MAYPEVVRVFATTQDPDHDSPWQTRSPSSSTGSGVVIAGGAILTGAHVVANATFLQVQKPSQPDKAIVRVRAVCHDADLALLEIVGDASFLADVPPAELGEMPKLRDQVSVVGYPVGGEEISITEGVVSRIEVQRYSHSQRHLLAVTVDAAINAGNSGGPVFGAGKVVGIAFQKLTGVDNIGEMVPPPVIRTFLDGVARGKPPQVPALGIVTQNLENPLLRARLGVPAGLSGVAVVQIDHDSAADGTLLLRDVITSVDGLQVANNGTVLYEGKHRTRFDVILGHHYVGDAIDVGILRDGVAMTIPVTLRPWRPLVPRTRYDQAPRYVIFGGLVFQALTRDVLTTWDKWWNKAPKEFLYYYYLGTRTAARGEVVILSQILADEINVGYGHLYNEGVATVNGAAPRDLDDFAARLDAAKGVVEVTTTSGGVIVLDADEVGKAMPRILDRYRIPRDRHLAEDIAMRKELVVTAGGREAIVAIERHGDGSLAVEVDGVARAVDARLIRPGTWSLVIDGASFTVDLDPRRAGVAASVGLAEAVLTVEDAMTRKLRLAAHRGPPPRGEAIHAPIAGKVVKLLCAIGDDVAPGQPVAVLEAMKMENEIVAERGGTVSELAKEPGQSVETGERLMTLT